MLDMSTSKWPIGQKVEGGRKFSSKEKIATTESCETDKIPERKNNRTSRLYKPSLKTYVP
jgi:hypothetical protein